MSILLAIPLILGISAAVGVVATLAFYFLLMKIGGK